MRARDDAGLQQSRKLEGTSLQPFRTWCWADYALGTLFFWVKSFLISPHPPPWAVGGTWCDKSLVWNEALYPFKVTRFGFPALSGHGTRGSGFTGLLELSGVPCATPSLACMPTKGRPGTPGDPMEVSFGSALASKCFSS